MLDDLPCRRRRLDRRPLGGPAGQRREWRPHAPLCCRQPGNSRSQTWNDAREWWSMSRAYNMLCRQIVDSSQNSNSGKM